MEIEILVGTHLKQAAKILCEYAQTLYQKLWSRIKKMSFDTLLVSVCITVICHHIKLFIILLNNGKLSF